MLLGEEQELDLDPSRLVRFRFVSLDLVVGRRRTIEEHSALKEKIMGLNSPIIIFGDGFD